MATLVLTAVGTAIGGPVGGSIGAMIGQAVDARIFAPKGREGPRLSDLRVQTSSYGTPIPRLYGRMRVAGTVIWSTDLIEHRQRQGGGKGRGSVTSYSYSASFAVALSSRAISRVRRIWAEGNLLRGAAGDFKSATGFRLHLGDEDQPVDPLMAAAEGVAACPAFRGLAYAVFEDMDLSPFGNRIPSLTFEVEADGGVVALSGVMGDLVGEAAAAAVLPPLAGAVSGGTSRRDGLEALARLAPVDRVPGERRWRLGEDASVPVALGEPAGERSGARPSRTLGDGGAVPRQISLSLFDPARDYQLSVQQARVAGGIGPAEAVALPLAMEAGAAKALVGQWARDSVRQARRCDWPAGFAALATPPGCRVQAGGAARSMVAGPMVAGLIAERRIEGAGVRLIIESGREPVAAALAADAGRVVAAPDAVIGASRGWLFDLPMIDGLNDGGGLVLAAGGEGPGWRQAVVSVRGSAGALPEVPGTVTALAVLGEVVAIEAAGAGQSAGQPWLFDRAGAMIVELLHETMVLSNADDAALLGGANLAVAGRELIQFGHAEPLGQRRWRLTQLLRGRFGSEEAMGDVAAGRGFALLADPALMPLPGAVQAGGAVLIEGQGDAAALVLPVTAVGRALRPLSPVAGTARWRDDGGVVLSWTRRSRLGSAWADFVDAPMDERDEAYVVTLTIGATVDVLSCALPTLALDTAAVAQWRALGSLLSAEVVQMGAAGPSPPLLFSVVL